MRFMTSFLRTWDLVCHQFVSPSLTKDCLYFCIWPYTIMHERRLSELQAQSYKMYIYSKEIGFYRVSLLANMSVLCYRGRPTKSWHQFMWNHFTGFSNTWVMFGWLVVTEMNNGGNGKNSSQYVFCLVDANVTGSLPWSPKAFSLLWPIALLITDGRNQKRTIRFCILGHET